MPWWMRCGGCGKWRSEERLPVAIDKRAAERMLEEMLVTPSGDRRHLKVCRNKGDAFTVERCKLALKLDYALIRTHCAEYDLELPHDVPSEAHPAASDTE